MQSGLSFHNNTLTAGVKVKYSSNKNSAVFQLCYFKLSVHPFHRLFNCSNMPFFKFLHEKFFSVGQSHLSDSLNQKQGSGGSFSGCFSSCQSGFSSCTKPYQRNRNWAELGGSTCGKCEEKLLECTWQTMYSMCEYAYICVC